MKFFSIVNLFSPLFFIYSDEALREMLSEKIKFHSVG